MSSKEIDKKLSSAMVALIGCITAVSPLSAEVPNHIVSNKISLQQPKKIKVKKCDSKNLIKSMTEIIKLQTILIGAFDNIYKNLLANDKDILNKIIKHREFNETVAWLSDGIKTMRAIQSKGDLEENISFFLDIIIAGSLNARLRANNISKLVKQMTVVPEMFESDVTEDDLTGIAKHAEKITKKYA